MIPYRPPAWLFILVLALVAVVLAARQFLTIKSTGLPLGPAMRVPGAIAQIIQTQERYLPSLHRNPNKDRFRLDLLVISLRDPTQQTFTLLRQQQSNALQPMTKILGAEGDVVWVEALDLMAVNVQTGRVARSADVLRVNPELRLFLPTARPHFAGRLFAVSPDWQQAYVIAADTLRASACPPPPRPTWAELRPTDDPDEALCAGVALGSTEWFGALSAEELRSFRPGVTLPREFPFQTKDRPRQLYRGRIDASEGRARIDAMEPIAPTVYRGAGLLRSAAGAAALRLSEPESLLLLYRGSSELVVPLALSRIRLDGQAAWTTDTGIGRLKQILPDPTCVAFIGERPPVPDKVPEPILVLLDTATGATETISLWR